MKHKWFRRLLYRRLLVALIILLQFGFLVYAILSGSRTSQAFTLLLELISLAAVVGITASMYLFLRFQNTSLTDVHEDTNKVLLLK